MIAHKTSLNQQGEGHAAARHVWESSGKNLAANGAVMRTSVLGLVNYHNLSIVEKNAINICKVDYRLPTTLYTYLLIKRVLS